MLPCHLRAVVSYVLEICWDYVYYFLGLNFRGLLSLALGAFSSCIVFHLHGWHRKAQMLREDDFLFRVHG